MKERHHRPLSSLVVFRNLFWLMFFVLFVNFSFTHLLSEQIKFDSQGKAAILMNADNGRILFEKNAYELNYPASTTKVATALYVLKLKNHNLNEVVEAKQEALRMTSELSKRKANFTLPPYWLEDDGTRIGIQIGEIFTYHQLLEGMLIPSGNDAPNVLAEGVSGSIPDFMLALNHFLKKLGCQNTNFCNPHGLHHPQHVTTAYDLALMTREALKYPVFREIVKQVRFTRPKTNKQSSAVYLHTNRLLHKGKLHYKPAIGVKTGYHSKAKNTFIGAAEMDGRTLIVVLLGHDDRQALFKEAIQLFETAFNQPKVQEIFFNAGPQSFSHGAQEPYQTLKTYLAEPLAIEYYPAENPEAKCFLVWESLTLPITKDQKVGELHLMSKEGTLLQKASIFALEAMKETGPTFFSYLLYGISAGILIGLCFLLVRSDKITTPL